MSKMENLEPLNRISSTISARDKKIWENEAHCFCIRQETEKLKNEIIKLEEITAEKEKENNRLEEQLSEISEFLVIEHQTLTRSDQSLLIHKLLKETLFQQSNEMKKKYASTLQMYDDEYQDYRSIYVKNSKGYKDLRLFEIKMRKLEITQMALEIKISNLRKILKQFKTIQKQMLQAVIVKFAYFYTFYQKNEKLCLQLEKMKAEEKQLLKEHLSLVKEVNEKQSKRSSARTQRQTTIEMDVNTNKSFGINDINEVDELERFLSEDIKPCSLTTLDSPEQQRLEFNQDNSKVRILDMKIARPFASQTKAMQKPDLELRKKMEYILKTTRKHALRADSIQGTPSASQESKQGEVPSGVSQTLSHLNIEDHSSAPQEMNVVAPMFKQQKNISLFSQEAQEETSKFFNIKKKTVTFQREDKVSPDINKKHEFIQKHVAQSNNEKTENQIVQSNNDQNNGGFVEMDVFRKPLCFDNEFNAKQKEKHENTTKTNLNRMFTYPVFGEDENQSMAYESAYMDNISTNALFSGPSNTVGNESGDNGSADVLCYDPFESGFETSLNQTLLIPPSKGNQNFAQVQDTFSFKFGI